MDNFKNILSETKIKIITNGSLAFYSYLFLHLTLKEDDKTETIATDGFNIFINKEWFLSIDSIERVYSIIAVVLHIALKHPTRCKGRDKKRWEAASDHVVNLLLDGYGLKKPSNITVYKEFLNKSVEEVYDMLEQESSSSPKSEPDHDDFKEPSASQEQENSEALEQAMTASKMQMEMSGTTSGLEGHSELSDIFRKLEKPKLPWAKILRRIAQKTAKEDYSFKKPNRRFTSDLILPSLFSDSLSRIDFILDVSGSIVEKEFVKMLTEVAKVLKDFSPEEIGLSQFDHRYLGTEVISKFTEASTIKLKGGGGTSIKETLEVVDKFKTELIIIFTDGYMNLNLVKPKTPVVWIIYDNANFKAPFGKKIDYDLED